MLSMEAAKSKDKWTAKYGVVLQHRHFAFIASVIKGMPDQIPWPNTHKASVAVAFADACSRSNPRFERERFLKACGL